MKHNKTVLALTLFFAASVAQPAQAGLLDWVNPFRLVTYVARTAWNHVCPITKYGLRQFEESEKNETTAKIDEILERERKSKADINLNFEDLNKKHDGLKEQAQELVKETGSLKQEATTLAQKLQDLKEQHDQEMPKVKKEADQLAKKYTAVLVLMGQVKQQVEENAKAARTLEEQLKSANSNMGGVTANIAQVKQQADKQMKKNVRIRSMAKEIMLRATSQSNQLLKLDSPEGFASLSTANKHQ